MDLGGGEGSKNNSRRISSVQYGPFESLLLQYTLTKIESHFISIQQQQKNSFLDCYTANVFQRLLFTITVAKREGGMRPGGGGAGGSETMRAPRAGGAGGQERKELEEGRRGTRREEGRQAFGPPVPAPTLTHHAHVHSSGDVYVQGRASPLTHTSPWMQGVAVLRHPRVPEVSPAEPPPSPGSVLPALRGQLCWAGVS